MSQASPTCPTSPTAPPPACDVLVVGAGPAGAACAQRLAGRGLQVVLVDQHEFPRDKVCGDGLIPDAHAAMARLGVLDEVLALAQPVAAVRCIAPRGHHVDVPGTLCVLPRRVLDHVLVRAAQRAGAVLATPWRFEGPLLDAAGTLQERVAGARLVARDGTVAEVGARWVVLATGAAATPLVAAGLAERHTPSGVALRGYVEHAALAREIQALQLVWHPRLKDGYGWIFPAPGGQFNIGTGVVGSHEVGDDGRGHKRSGGPNLRRMFDAFCEVHEPAQRLVREGRWTGELKGAPLRCSLTGARFGRPGLLGTGEAIGSTYAFTGEGIGKALETGLAAAEALLLARADDADVLGHYSAALAALKPRFDTYETASYVNRWPWIADIVVSRARRRPAILRRLQGLLEETQNPGNLFSWRGVKHLMFE
jgi:flavin-dependent dehydrogenase